MTIGWLAQTRRGCQAPTSSRSRRLRESETEIHHSLPTSLSTQARSCSVARLNYVANGWGLCLRRVSHVNMACIQLIVSGVVVLFSLPLIVGKRLRLFEYYGFAAEALPFLFIGVLFLIEIAS